MIYFTRNDTLVLTTSFPFGPDPLRPTGERYGLLFPLPYQLHEAPRPKQRSAGETNVARSDEASKPPEGESLEGFLAYLRFGSVVGVVFLGSNLTTFGRYGSGAGIIMVWMAPVPVRTMKSEDQLRGALHFHYDFNWCTFLSSLSCPCIWRGTQGCVHDSLRATVGHYMCFAWYS